MSAHADHSSGNKEGHDVLGSHDDLPDLVLDLRQLRLEAKLSAHVVFVRNRQGLELSQLGDERLLKLRTHALLLELVETMHDDVLRVKIFNTHHVQQHFVT